MSLAGRQLHQTATVAASMPLLRSLQKIVDVGARNMRSSRSWAKGPRFKSTIAAALRQHDVLASKFRNQPG
jgi:hypothetical protein